MVTEEESEGLPSTEEGVAQPVEELESWTCQACSREFLNEIHDCPFCADDIMAVGELSQCEPCGCWFIGSNDTCPYCQADRPLYVSLDIPVVHQRFGVGLLRTFIGDHMAVQFELAGEKTLKAPLAFKYMKTTDGRKLEKIPAIKFEMRRFQVV